MPLQNCMLFSFRYCGTSYHVLFCIAEMRVICPYIFSRSTDHIKKCRCRSAWHLPICIHRAAYRLPMYIRGSACHLSTCIRGMRVLSRNIVDCIPSTTIMREEIPIHPNSREILLRSEDSETHNLSIVQNSHTPTQVN